MDDSSLLASGNHSQDYELLDRPTGSCAQPVLATGADVCGPAGGAPGVPRARPGRASGRRGDVPNA